MSDTPLEKPKEQYAIRLTLDQLKFVYTSCVEHILQLDDRDFYHDRSIVQLKTCIAVYNEIEKLDPDWLVCHGFAYDKGFHLSWLEWFQTLKGTEKHML